MDVQPWPTDMPKFSVIRLETSNERPNCEAGGTSAVLDQATVGSDISSAMQGSSVASVAGKNRAPTKQWAEAQENETKVIKTPSANARACLDKRNMGVSVAANWNPAAFSRREQSGAER